MIDNHTVDPLAGPTVDPLGTPTTDELRASLQPLGRYDKNFKPQPLDLPPLAKDSQRTHLLSSKYGSVEVSIDTPDSCRNAVHSSGWHLYRNSEHHRIAKMCPAESTRRTNAKAAKLEENDREY